MLSKNLIMTEHAAPRYRGKIAEQALARKLVRQTHFSEREVDSLMKIYKQFAEGKDYLDKDRYIEILHNSLGMTDEFFMERVFVASDTIHNGRIHVAEFVQSLSIMLRGTIQEKTKFCFTAYDIKDDMQLNREVLCTLLKQSFINQSEGEDPEDSILDMVEIFMKRMDTNYDGILTFSEYAAAVENDLLLLEVFGPILPDDKFRVAFLAMFAEDYPFHHTQ